MTKNKPTPGIKPIDNWKNEALSDRGFSSVIKNSIGVVGNKIDGVIFISSLGAGLVGVAIARIYFNQLGTAPATAKLVQQWSSFGAGIAVAILGFLIAGFSVFATVTRPTFFHVLAKFRREDRPFSEFKFVFYNFMYIFAHYIIYMFICMISSAMFVPMSPVWFLGQLSYDYFPKFVDVFTASWGALVICYTIYTVLLLRSFLWNLYQSLLFAIFYEEPKT